MNAEERKSELAKILRLDAQRNDGSRQERDLRAMFAERFPANQFVVETIPPCRLAQEFSLGGEVPDADISVRLRGDHSFYTCFLEVKRSWKPDRWNKDHLLKLAAAATRGTSMGHLGVIVPDIPRGRRYLGEHALIGMLTVEDILRDDWPTPDRFGLEVARQPLHPSKNAPYRNDYLDEFCEFLKAITARPLPGEEVA